MSDEFVEAQLKYLVVVAPDGTNQGHAGLPDVDAVTEFELVFGIVWAFGIGDIVDYAQVVQALVHHFE